MRNRQTRWFTAQHQPIRVCNMADRHLQNTINFVTRLCNKIPYESYIYLGGGFWTTHFHNPGDEEWHGRSWYEWLEILEEERERRIQERNTNA